MPQPSLLRTPAFMHWLTRLAQRAVRSRLLPVAGITIGLIAAGAGLFRVAAPPVVQVPPGYIAVVNGKGVLVSDFIAQTAVEMQKPFNQTTHAERLQVLNDMIDTELMVQRALALDLPLTTVEVRFALQDAVIGQVSAPVLANKISDAELRAYYREHRADYTTDGSMLIHDLVLRVGGYRSIDQTVAQAKSDAAEAVYQLRSGAPISYVEEHFGFVDSGRIRHIEQLDFAAKIHLGNPLYKVAKTLGDGQVSDPIVAADGVHVLIMDRRRPPQLADFGDVRRKVYKNYQQTLINQATQANLKRLRARANILVPPDYLQ